MARAVWWVESCLVLSTDVRQCFPNFFLVPSRMSFLLEIVGSCIIQRLPVKIRPRMRTKDGSIHMGKRVQLPLKSPEPQSLCSSLHSVKL